MQRTMWSINMLSFLVFLAVVYISFGLSYWTSAVYRLFWFDFIVPISSNVQRFICSKHETERKERNEKSENKRNTPTVGYSLVCVVFENLLVLMKGHHLNTIHIFTKLKHQIL